jgi:hypothetical protein
LRVLGVGLGLGPAFLAVALSAQAPAAKPQPQGAAEAPAEFKPLKYRSIGPAAGGRVSRVAGIPGDPSTYYAATASRSTTSSSRSQKAS